MKTKILLLFSFFMTALLVFNSKTMAQEGHSKRLTREMRINKMVQNPFSQEEVPSLQKHLKDFVISGIQAQVEEINSRLIAVSASFYDGVLLNPADSMHLFYSGANHTPGLENYLSSMYYYTPSLETYKEFIELDLVLRVDSLYNYNWNSGIDEFFMTSKLVSTFDANGNIISQTTIGTSDGINFYSWYRVLYTQDGAGNFTSIIEQDWTGSVWENYSKKTYSYNSNHQILEKSIYYWQYSTSEWIKSDRLIATYEGSNISSLISQYNDGGEWTNNFRSTNIYSSGNHIEHIGEYWNAGDWKKSHKILNTHNSQNRLIKEEILYWNSTQYDPEYLTQWEYNEAGHVSALIEHNWDGAEWKSSYRTDLEYSNGEISRTSESYWNGAEFENDHRLNYLRNGYGQPTVISGEEWDGTQWKESTWTFTTKFYYEEFDDASTGLSSAIHKENVSLFPNPTSEYVNVNLNGQILHHIKIIDTTGKVVFETQPNFSATEFRIPVGHLKNGVYILNVNGNNQSGSQTFVVQH